MSFSDIGLDPRILRGVQKRGLSTPTAVQLECIPKLLEGKDVVARARTGSGKTLAYLLPALHKVVTTRQVDQAWQALVLVPTKELCEQVKTEAQATAAAACPGLQVTSLVAEGTVQAAAGVAQAGQLVVSTPGRIAALIRGGQLPGSLLQSRLHTLVLDEADLLLAFGYWDDLQVLAAQVPRSCQCILMSATVSDKLEELQKLVLHNPLAINLLSAPGADPAALGSGSGTAAEIQHFALECAQCDKLLCTMPLLKLNMVRRKVLIFTNSVNSGYKLRLFLEGFGIRSALLHNEMPLNTRSHILQSFNKGLFDNLIAAESLDPDTGPSKGGGGNGGAAPGAEDDGNPDGGKKSKKVKRKGSKHKATVKDEEFGVTRGIDFKGVRTVINFDLPSSVREYVHRVGRTGRAGEFGMAVTLFSPEDKELRESIDACLKTGADGASTGQMGPGPEEDIIDGEGEPAARGLQVYTRLQPATVEAFRYRAEDAARAITKKAIQEARAKEMRLELLNSEKLKEYFEEHAAERRLLQHDKVLHKGMQGAAHLKHVPAYIRAASSGGVGVGLGAGLHRRPKSRKLRAGQGLAKNHKARSSVDPLKVMKKATKK